MVSRALFTADLRGVALDRAKDADRGDAEGQC
jgi:hypothetical protein